jgi:hypothetical protein
MWYDFWWEMSHDWRFCATVGMFLLAALSWILTLWGQPAA